MKIYVTYLDDGDAGFGQEYWVLEDNAKEHVEKYNGEVHAFKCVMDTIYTTD
jgi:hypothetical protein